jgi:hypothetical protein
MRIVDAHAFGFFSNKQELPAYSRQLLFIAEKRHGS